MESADDVAGQIEVLLLGLAKRADSAGLAVLAGQLRAVAGEAGRQARGGSPQNTAPARARPPNE